jgi:predicted exporter
LILAAPPPLLWPVALAMLCAVLIAFGFGNLYVLVLASGRSHQATAARDLNGLLVAALGLTLLELAALSMLRTWLAASFGFTWGV